MSKKNIQRKSVKGKTSNGNSNNFKEKFKRLLPLIFSLLLWAVLLIILRLPGIEEYTSRFFIKLTVWTIQGVGAVFFIPIETSGLANIAIWDFPMKVVVECSAYNFYLFVFALAVFSKGSTLSRAIDLGIYWGFIMFLNILRFLVMAIVGNHFPDLFHQLHDYAWNILFGLLVFLIWAWRTERRNKKLNAV